MASAKHTLSVSPGDKPGPAAPAFDATIAWTAGQHATEPSREPAPGPQDAHTLAPSAPVVALKVPGGHPRHALALVAPSSLLYVPVFTTTSREREVAQGRGGGQSTGMVVSTLARAGAHLGCTPCARRSDRNAQRDKARPRGLCCPADNTCQTHTSRSNGQYEGQARCRTSLPGSRSPNPPGNTCPEGTTALLRGRMQVQQSSIQSAPEPEQQSERGSTELRCCRKGRECLSFQLADTSHKHEQ